MYKITFGNTVAVIFFAFIMQQFYVQAQDWIEAKDDAHSLSHGEKTKCDISDTTVNCTYMYLRYIPDTFPLNVTILDLSNNYITEINRNLSIYIQLQKLYLRSNSIERFVENCFKGLESLEHLDLQDNKLVMNNVTFPDGVFKDLKSLRILKLNKNHHNLNNSELFYPDRALSDLNNLTTLHIDGLKDRRFGEGFKNMLSLRNLIIIGGRDGYCQMEKLHNDTFYHLSQLEVLQINRCFINGSLMNRLTFNPLKRLRRLDLNYDELIFFHYLAPALKNVDSENFTHLIIHDIMSPYTPCAKVTKDFAQSLPRSLTHIVATSNGLAMVEPEVFGLLPPNLTYLDLSKNRFMFGSYLKHFPAMLSLETLILNGKVESYDLPKWYPRLENSFLEPYSQHYSYPSWDPVVLHLPPKLKHVSMDKAGLTYALSEFHINPNNTLETLILNGNKIQSLKGPFTGLNKLKSLSLANCFIYHINHNFFDNFTSLEFLNLSTNAFGSKVLKNGRTPIFKNLKNLKELDISFTNILTIDWNVFEGLDSLEKLHIQRNGMYYFRVNIRHMPNLNFVNFSLTQLAFLVPSVREVFDSIAKNHNLSIDFSENPIHCYCSNLHFISWLTNTLNNIQFVNLASYKCVYEDSSEKYFPQLDVEALLHDLNHQCIPNVTLFITVTAITFLVLCAISIMVLYKFRWKLRYLYYSAYLYFKNTSRNKDLSEMFEFDVFVSFASEDDTFVHETLTPELKSRGLNVLIHTVDFIAGQYITTNIVNAVQSSRKTLIVVSRHLLKSTWCRFELQMANMETVHTGRPVMIFLLVEQPPKEEMDRELLYHIQNNTYMQLPHDRNDANAMDKFWRKLCSDVIK